MGKPYLLLMHVIECKSYENEWMKMVKNDNIDSTRG